MTLAESIQALVAQVSKIGGESAGLLQRIVDLEAEVSRLRKLVVPFYWNTVTLNFTNGTAASVNLATFLVNPQSRTVTYTVKSGSLPSGCTLSGSTVSYNGTGAVGASSVQFSATQGGYVADSAVITASIAAAQVGNRAPVWSTIPAQTTTAGTPLTFSVGPYASDPDGDPMTFGRTGGAADTAPAGVTVSSAGVLSVPANTAPGSYTVEVYADDGQGGALADWQARANAAGVVWAHRFSDSTADYWLRQGEYSTAVTRRLSTDGIIGDGCLEMFIPAGQTPGNVGFGRPLAPVQAYSALGISADVNKAGLTAIPFQTFYSYNGNEGFKKLSNMRGGCFGNAAYFDATQRWPGVPDFVWSGQFWIQYRVKLSASRLLPTEHIGKLFILDHNSGGTDLGELVQGIWANYRTAWPAGPYWYGAQGRWLLTNPQGEPAGCNYLPGSTYTACTYGQDTAANCWSYPADTWMTFNIGVTPGRKSVSSDGGYQFTTKYYDAGLIVKVAVQGATSWTTLINKSDYYWYYDGQYGNDIPAQWGWAGQQVEPGFNEIRFMQFNGGAEQTAVKNDISVKLDQIICSTTEPALPQY